MDLALPAGLIPVLLLVLAAEFVNGWTDAPNAIATVVSTRVLTPSVAVVMATGLNIWGPCPAPPWPPPSAKASSAPTPSTPSPSPQRWSPSSFGAPWPPSAACPPVRATPWWRHWRGAPPPRPAPARPPRPGGGGPPP